MRRYGNSLFHNSMMKSALFNKLADRYWLQILVVALFYFLAAELGLLMMFKGTNASPVWPPAGLALAAILLGGWRLWPGILIGAFTANLVSFLANEVPFTASLLMSLSIGGGNTLEALTGILLLRMLGCSGAPFSKLIDVFRFIFLSVMLAPAVSATIGRLFLCLVNLVVGRCRRGALGGTRDFSMDSTLCFLL